MDTPPAAVGVASVLGADIRVRVGALRRVSWAFEYAVDRADGLRCVDMTTVQVLLDRGGTRATRIPEDLRVLLSA